MTKTLEELKEEMDKITQDIVSLASLSDIMKAKEICDRVIEHSWNMAQYGADKITESITNSTK